jgi:hypothetical protein
MTKKRVPVAFLAAMLGTASPLIRDAVLFLSEVAGTLLRKNRAYGDSIGDPLMMFSQATTEERLRSRIDDKLSRIIRGDGSGDENDMGDLVGYLAMLYAAKRKAR